MTDKTADTTPDQAVTVLTGRRIPWGRISLGVLAFVLIVTLGAIYYKRTNEGLTDVSAIDQAQIARNISEGRGFTTHFIRPFNASMIPGDALDLPELNNAPLFPYIVAVLCKLRNPCDQVVSWASLGFFALTLVATFALGVVLFDWKAGLLAAGVVGLSSSALDVGTSGSEQSLAALELTGLLVVLALHHTAGDSKRAALGWVILAAVLTALLYMTNYVFAYAVIPMAIYFGVTGRLRRLSLVSFLIAVVVLMAPCAYRNATLTGFPVLGVRAWDVMADTMKHPGQTLFRSATADQQGPLRALFFPLEEFGSFARKLVLGSVDVVAALPSMVGFAALAFAAVSVLYRFKSSAANALRGLLYGLAPLMILVFGAYSGTGAWNVIFAPAIAVFASAYLLLLLEAKKLHPFFARSLVAAFLAVTVVPTLACIVWGVSPPTRLSNESKAAHDYYGSLGSRGVNYLVYTDVPWIAAWRTTGRAVWLPRKDSDVYAMEAKGLPMRIVILTPECDNYSADETWWMLHRLRLWRTYVEDPRRGTKDILSAVKIEQKDVPLAVDYLRRLKRNYAISTTISGFIAKQQDPLSPDDIQVFVHPDLAVR